MKAVILAAGMGRRLASAGWTKPKSLLPIAGDRSLLDNLMLALAGCGVTECIVVVGYQSEVVQAAAGKHPMRLQFVSNPNYAQTNTIYSLHLALANMDDDFLYFNADVLFDPQILDLLLKTSGTCLAVESKRCGEEEVKVITGQDGRITRIGKKLPVSECHGEFIGVGKFEKDLLGDFKESLRFFNVDLNERNLFFEAAVDRICHARRIQAVDIDPYQAIEIDTPEDLERARELARLNPGIVA